MELAIILPTIAVGNDAELACRRGHCKCSVNVGDSIVGGYILFPVHNHCCARYVGNCVDLGDAARYGYAVNAVASCQRSVGVVVIGQRRTVIFFTVAGCRDGDRSWGNLQLSVFLHNIIITRHIGGVSACYGYTCNGVGFCAGVGDAAGYGGGNYVTVR